MTVWALGRCATQPNSSCAMRSQPISFVEAMGRAGFVLASPVAS
jgi:hypothetical protein